MKKISKFWQLLLVFGLIQVPSKFVYALELDWSGQFWSEYNFILGYTSESNGGYTSSRAAAGGYYVPGGGKPSATFGNVFLRVKPKIIVNDNIYIKSEWWVGDPIYGLFGSALPYSVDQHQYYSNQSRGSVIRAQRVWGEFVSDIGTFQVGRLPLNWGLGLVWNGGDNVWDRYMSTGDGVRWLAKFGSFSVSPSFIFQSAGNAIGGNGVYSPAGTYSLINGSGSVTDISLIAKYENTEDDLEAGINVIKRLSGTAQDPRGGMSPPDFSNPTYGIDYYLYDLYARKRLNKFTLAVEVPIASGTVAGLNYSGWGAAAEAGWKPADSLDFLLKAGAASGQKSGFAGPSLDQVGSFYFNPNYHIGMIMFNYQLANFAGPQTLNNPTASQGLLVSPYDNPIVNAVYAALSAQVKPWEKWTFRPALIYAMAPRTASATGNFYNTWSRTVQSNTTGVAQGSSLGWEADLGISFQWDDYFTFLWDNGLFFPGSFYAFSNSATPNAQTPVFATSLRIGVNF